MPSRIESLYITVIIEFAFYNKRNKEKSLLERSTEYKILFHCPEQSAIARLFDGSKDDLTILMTWWCDLCARLANRIAPI